MEINKKKKIIKKPTKNQKKPKIGQSDGITSGEISLDLSCPCPGVLSAPSATGSNSCRFWFSSEIWTLPVPTFSREGGKSLRCCWAVPGPHLAVVQRSWHVPPSPSAKVELPELWAHGGHCGDTPSLLFPTQRNVENCLR